jgi:1,4-alpha-glucan branching enzyme
MGLRWINYSDHQNAVISFIRKGNKVKDDVFVVCNFTQVIRENYRIGIQERESLKKFLIVMQKYMEEVQLKFC